MASTSPKKAESLKATNNSKGEPWEDNFRLPLSVHPDHYKLHIHPNLESKTFSGEVTIQVTSSEGRNYFLVHTKWLTISETSIVKIVDGTSQDVEITEAFNYEPNEFWVMKTKDVVEPGLFEISLKFNGSLTNGIVGFYYSEYTNEAGKIRSLATTKFEPTYCRQSFPSFDEPNFKSTYDISIVRPSDGYIALSNMPVKTEISDAPSVGLTTVKFDKSVPMVTYLVCFIVCDFSYNEAILPSGMPFRVYGPAGRLGNTQYSLDFGKEVLQLYEKMFDLPFPLPKSDMAAIPDYSSGATEHWGIITFRESNLFYNENTSSAVNHQRVSSVVAHELAHQWFGNLVTLSWWNDLWLNEGFANYVETKGVAHMHQDWDMSSQFIIENLQAVFNLDSKLSSHPIVQVVETPNQINAMFDLIAYEKGSSVLRMLENFIGESVFTAGINNFLKKYAYDNAITQDLWDQLTLAWAGHVPAGQKGDVGEIMDTWTRQMGYPVITVSRITPDTLNVTQKRFLADPTAVSNPDDSAYKYKWDIPISYKTSDNNGENNTWFYREDNNLEIKVNTDVTWYKFNLNQMGYFRINYDADVWKQLQALCASQDLNAADRSNLYDDAFALADASLLDYNIALNLSTSLSTETHYVPWVSANKHFVVMANLLLQTDGVATLFMDYMNNLIGPIYQTLGWENNGDHLQKLLRSQIVSFACFNGNDECLNEAAKLFQSWIDDATFKLPLGTERQIYRRGVVRAGGQSNWDTMWQRCLKEQSASKRDNYYYGLANSQDEAILASYLEMAKVESNVRTADFLKLVQYVASNPAGSELTWKWVRDNWEWLVARYTLTDRYLGELIPNITKYFATSEKLKEMEEFFLKYPESGAGELFRKQALENLQMNIRWVESYATTIKDWLNSHNTA